MAEVLCKVLAKHKLAVISGASYKQFQKQFLPFLHCPGEILENLYLFPANGTACYRYDNLNNAWQVYDEKMTSEEKEKIFSGFKKALAESGVDVANPYGDLVEDRGGQVTFSGRGQEAPLEVKEKWDPDQKKRRKIVEILEKEIPEFEIKIGGATSIDVTHKGIDKAYAIGKIEQFLPADKGDVIFLGDALFPGGNDSSAREAGVQCISVSGPKDAEKVLTDIL
jgi:HAD superfamily hydrolase (TIGR01484 family)